MMRAASGLFRPFVHLFFPPVCVACGTGMPLRAAVCASCWEALKPVPQPICDCCGRNLPSEMIDADLPDYRCGACRMRSRVTWSRMRSAYCYVSPLREIIHQFKFSGFEAIGTELGKLLAAAVPQLCDAAPVDLVVPVPSHLTRLMERGFNPAAVLARFVSRAVNRPLLVSALRKLRHTAAQSSLDIDDRRRNLRNAFAAEKARVKGKRVLLVDDVFTTGATLDECALTLRRAGASEVIAVTLARAEQL